MYAAVFRWACVIRAAGIEEMLDLCDAFAHQRCAIGNPVDLTVEGSGAKLIARILRG